MTRQPPTADEDLLHCLPGPSWSDDGQRVERIRREIAVGFEALAPIGKAVSVFGSARVPHDDPLYDLTRRVAAELGQAGFAVITGGGPGLMEAPTAARETSARPPSVSASSCPTNSTSTTTSTLR